MTNEDGRCLSPPATTVDDMQMHYVIGGHGPQVMVLLHGWPHSENYDARTS